MSSTPRNMNLGSYHQSSFRRQHNMGTPTLPSMPAPGSILPSAGVSHDIGINLSDEYGEQIEYNNQLLQQLQQAEAKNQEKTRQLTERDQEVRNVRLDMQQLRKEIDILKEENYRVKLSAQQAEGELEHYQRQMEELQREKRYHQQEQKQMMKKLESSMNTIVERENQMDALDHELRAMRDDYNGLEDAHKETSKGLETMTKRYLDEKNKVAEVRTQLNWNQKKAMEDNGSLQVLLNETKDKYHKIQAEHTQLNLDKERLEKSEYEMRIQLQDKDLSHAAEMRELEKENDGLNKKLERLLTESSEKSRHFYQYMNSVQQEFKQWSNIADVLREQYNTLAANVHDTHITVQNLENFEGMQTEVIYNEMKEIIDQVNSHIANQVKLEDTAQGFEVALEEERARSIMLEERASRLQQQATETQRRAENSEKRAEERFNMEIDRVRNELASTKSENKKLTDEVQDVQQEIHSLQTGKRDSEEREKVQQNQIRSLTESIKRLQKQLEQTKNLLKMVQDERLTMNDESESLRRELHSVLQGNDPRQSVSSPIPPTNSLHRENRPDSAFRTSIFTGKPISSASNTPNPSSMGLNLKRISSFGERRNSLDGSSMVSLGSPLIGIQSPRAADTQPGVHDFKSHLFSKFHNQSHGSILPSNQAKGDLSQVVERAESLRGKFSSLHHLRQKLNDAWNVS